MWQLPLPLAIREELHITVPRGVRAPRRRGAIGHQAELSSEDVRVVRGIRVTSPARTFTDLARILDDRALIALADGLIGRRRPLTSPAELRDAVRRAAVGRGTRRALAALGRMDPGSESPKETELRLLLCDAGFGPFAANHALYDSTGLFIARVDLALVELRIAVEYEGDHHRERAQWRRDIARRRRLEAAGWIYIPVTQADLDDPRGLLQDLSAAIASRS